MSTDDTEVGSTKMELSRMMLMLMLRLVLMLVFVERRQHPTPASAFQGSLAPSKVTTTHDFKCQI